MPRAGAVLLIALATVAGVPGRAGDPAGDLLLVANKGDQTLGIIDLVAGRQVATVKQIYAGVKVRNREDPASCASCCQ